MSVHVFRRCPPFVTVVLAGVSFAHGAWMNAIDDHYPSFAPPASRRRDPTLASICRSRLDPAPCSSPPLSRCKPSASSWVLAAFSAVHGGATRVRRDLG